VRGANGKGEKNDRNDPGNIKETNGRSNFALDEGEEKVSLKSKHLRRHEESACHPDNKV
jgi:hypothetical protein